MRHIFVLTNIWMLSFGAAFAAPNHLNRMPPTDTSIVAVSQKQLELRKKQRQYIALLSVESLPDPAEGTYLLQLEDLRVDPLPEGVYEIFLSAQAPRGGRFLDPDAPHLIGLLNLFNFQQGNTLSLDASETASKVLAQPINNGTLYLVLQFRGNTRADGKIVPHAGHLTCQRARLLRLEQ